MSAALIVFVKLPLPCFASELFVIKHRVSSSRKQHRKFRTCILQVGTDFSRQCGLKMVFMNKLIKATSAGTVKISSDHSAEPDF